MAMHLLQWQCEVEDISQKNRPIVRYPFVGMGGVWVLVGL